MEETLRDYYNIKTQIDSLEGYLASKKEAVLAYLRTVEGNKVETDFAKFTVRKTPKWDFSQAVFIEEERARIASQKIKEIKDLEIKTGVAKKLGEVETVVLQIIK